MATHNDYLGTEVQVGDIVVYSDSKYADLNTAMVTKRNPTLLQVNGYHGVSAKQCMVVTDKYMKEFNQQYLDMLNKYQSKFQKDAKAPRAVKRYTLTLMDHKDSKAVSLAVNVIVDGKKDKNICDLGDFTTYGYTNIVRKQTDDIWRTGVTDDLELSDRWRDRKFIELPAKLLQKYFGNVPEEAGIVAEFDDMEACKDYLKSVGVSV
jgi:hypothetical protein